MMPHSALFAVWVVAELLSLSSAEILNGCDTEAVVGYCFGVGCFLGHGKAACKGLHCMCDVGFCSYDGWHCVDAPTNISDVTSKTRTSTSSVTTTTYATTIPTTTTSPTAQTYIDLGVGKCLANGKDPAYVWIDVAHDLGTVSCEDMCTTDNMCYGYSKSDFGNCLLWTQSELSGGGVEWGGAHCIVKAPPQMYADLGPGKCLADGKDPAYEYHPNNFNAPSCEQQCNTKHTCYGYSKSIAGNCLLWTQSGLSGGGADWGAAHCHVKEPVPSQQPTTVGRYVDVGAGKCLGYNGVDPAFVYHGSEDHGSDCERLCNEKQECHGYSQSIFGGCLLWMQPWLTSGGARWGNAHCHIKAPTHHQQYIDIGEGKCQGNANDGHDFKWYSEQRQKTADCEQLCTVSSDCHGYSKSMFGGCLLFTQPALYAGDAWGGAHCFIKAFTATVAEMSERPLPSHLATNADISSPRVVMMTCILVGASLAALLLRTFGLRRSSPLTSPMLLEA